MANTTQKNGGAARILLIIVLAAVALAAAVAAYIWFRGGSGEATQALVAPTLDLSARTPEADATPDETEAPAALAAATSTAVSEAQATEPTDAASAAAGILFEIVPAESQVRFTLTELLRGQPTTVVGITDQVAGQVFVDFANPSASQIGTIRINVRTMETDNEFRNRAIRSEILQTNDYEFSDFTPTGLRNLPDTITMGTPISFLIDGDLTVRDRTNPVTFDATVTPVSETRLEGTATATVQRAPFELVIPNVPSVANVSEDVVLEIDFVATAAAS